MHLLQAALEASKFDALFAQSSDATATSTSAPSAEEQLSDSIRNAANALFEEKRVLSPAVSAAAAVRPQASALPPTTSKGKDSD